MNPFNGRFDELLFPDRVLTADEIAAQYTLCATPPVPEPASAALLLATAARARRLLKVGPAG